MSQFVTGKELKTITAKAEEMAKAMMNAVHAEIKGDAISSEAFLDLVDDRCRQISSVIEHAFERKRIKG